MTAIIVIENYELSKTVTVDEEVLKSFGSAIYIEVGEKITVEDLLYGLMLRSGNDAAIVLAEEISGSMGKFAELMNAKVKDLGLENTIFYNNHGLETDDGENISSAYDMAIITNYAMDSEEFRKIFATESYNTKTNYKSYSWDNKNKLLGYGDYITGGKTGYTKKANRTLVTTSSKNNMDLVVVTLNDGNDWDDHKYLHEKVFDDFEAIKVIDKELTSYEDGELTLYVKNDYYALISKNDEENIKLKYEIYNDIISSVKGKVKVYYDDNLIYEDNLYILNEEEEKESLWDRIVRWFSSW